MILPEAPAAVAALQQLCAAPDWIYRSIIHTAAAALMSCTHNSNVWCLDAGARNNTHFVQT